MLLMQTLDRHFAVGAAQNGLARLRLEGHARPNGLCVRRLHDEHIQTVARFGLTRVRETHSRRHRRIVDGVKDVLGLVRQVVERCEIFLREHADRRGVQDNLNIARNMAAAEHRNVRVRHGIGDLLLKHGRLFEVAAGDGEVRALACAVVRHDGRRAAVAEQQDLFAFEGHLVARQRLRKAENVGVVADG